MSPTFSLAAVRALSPADDRLPAPDDTPEAGPGYEDSSDEEGPRLAFLPFRVGSPNTPHRPARDQLEAVARLLAAGLPLQAFQVSRALGSLRWWDGSEARGLAVSLAHALGAPKLAQTLAMAAFRQTPDHPLTRLQAAQALLTLRGPLAALQTLDAGLQPTGNTPRALVLSLRAHLLALFRDFDQARSCLNQALDLAPDCAQAWSSQAQLELAADRHAQALEATEQALILEPYHLEASALRVNLLCMLGRREETIPWLEQGAHQVEWAQLSWLKAEQETALERWQDAWNSLMEAERRSPLIHQDHTARAQLDAHRAQLAYQLGEHEQARALARRSGASTLQRVLERTLQTPQDSRRQVLPVPHVQQHEGTCAPAVLSALAHYWQRPVDQLEVAADICYQGTTRQRIRAWAEGKGFAVLEFDLGWEAAVGLLDRGIPFAFLSGTHHRGHVRCVVGYDTRIGALICQNPSHPQPEELDLPGLLSAPSSHPACGMVLVPEAERPRLADLNLPSSPAYDLAYQLQRALDRGARAEARELLAALQRLAPTHLETRRCQLSLAIRDGDLVTQLEVLQRLREAFPQDGSLVLGESRCLRELARPADRLKLLHRAVWQHPEEPELMVELAEALITDVDTPSQRKEASRWLRRALGIMPLEGRAVRLLGSLEASPDAILRMSRLAACLHEKDEQEPAVYFAVASAQDRAGEAEALLRRRYDTWGAQSSLPAQTLCQALTQRGDRQGAREVLEQALRAPSADGYLRLLAAQLFTLWGDVSRAQALLLEAQGQTAPPHWLEAAARVAEGSGELSVAAAHWDALLQAWPHHLGAVESLAQLLHAREGKAQALRFLQQRQALRPDDGPLGALVLSWLSDGSVSAADETLDRLVERHPSDVALLCRQATRLLASGRRGEARHRLKQAARIAPESPHLLMAQAQLKQQTGDPRGAQQLLWQALEADVDNLLLQQQYLAAHPTFVEKQAAVRRLLHRLPARTRTGQGLLVRRQARAWLAPYELSRAMEEARRARPELWLTWQLSIEQLVEVGNLEGALACSAAAVTRFPQREQLWRSHARALLRNGRREAMEEALWRAYQLNPAYPEAVTALAEHCLASGRQEEARTLIQGLAPRLWNDPLHLWHVAFLEWQLGAEESSLDHLLQVLRLAPELTPAWEQLYVRSQKLGRPGLILSVARGLTRERPEDPEAWMALARATCSPEEGLNAWQRAIALDPRSMAAHLGLAGHHLTTGQLELAFAALHPPALGPTRPAELLLEEARAWRLQGEQARALSLLNQAVEQEPFFQDGLSTLAQWHLETEAWSEALVATQRLVEVAPGEPESWLLRAQVQEGQGKVAEARGDLARALYLEHGQPQAVERLFALAVAEDEPEEARRVLARERAQLPRALAANLDLRLALADGDERSRDAAIRELCRAKDGGSSLYESGLRALEAQESPGLKVWDREATHPQAAPAALVVRVKRCCDRQEFGVVERLLERLPEGAPAYTHCVVTLFHAWSRLEAREAMLRYISRWGERLRQASGGWSLVGSVLFRLGELEKLTQWMSDYAVRPEARPMDLLRLGVAHRRLGNVAQALEVHRVGMALANTDEPMQEHLIYVALHDALADGLSHSASQALALRAADFDAPWEGLLRLTQALATLQAAPEDARPQLAEQYRPLFAPGRYRLDCLADALLAEQACRKLATLSGSSPQRWLSAFVQHSGQPLGGSLETTRGSGFPWWLIFFLMLSLARAVSSWLSH